ncbi:FixH family protein [Fulvimarina sp. MAC3]|uniref:FixH family protein n=1 Tax=Fulvimarina sp. MAC3 TaxID=3148887 RepID=UPI0031FCBA07
MLDTILARREFTGWHMLAIMLAFFGTVIAVNVTMAIYAASTWSGLVVENSYVASQHFDTDAAERRRENGLGYRLAATYGNGTFSLDAFQAGEPRAIESVTVDLGRPVGAVETLVLENTGGNGRSANIDLAPGAWEADVTAVLSDGERLERVIRFEVPNDRGAER